MNVLAIYALERNGKKPFVRYSLQPTISRGSGGRNIPNTPTNNNMKIPTITKKAGNVKQRVCYFVENSSSS